MLKKPTHILGLPLLNQVCIWHPKVHLALNVTKIQNKKSIIDFCYRKTCHSNANYTEFLQV